MNEKKKFPAAALVVIVIILIGAAVFILSGGRGNTPEKPASTAGSPTESAASSPEPVKTPDMETMMSNADDLIQREEYRAAIKILEKVLKMDGINREDVLRKLAMSYRESRDFDGAIVYYKELVEIKPENPEYNCKYARCRYQLGEYEEAIKLADKANSLKSDYVEAIYNLADANYKKGSYKEALKYYREGLKYNQFRHIGTYGVVESLIGLKLKDEAKKHARALPGSIKNQCRLGTIFFDTRHYDEAVEEFTRAIEFKPDRDQLTDIVSMVGECYQAMGRPDKRTEYIKKMTGKFPRVASDVESQEGKYHLILRSYAPAEEYFKNAIKYNKKNQVAYLGLVQVYGHTDQLDKADEIMKQAGDLFPGDPEVMATEAWLCSLHGQKDKVKSLVDKAVKLAPDNHYVLLEAARAYRGIKDYKKAQDFYEESIEKAEWLHEEHVSGTMELGSLLMETGNKERGEKKFRTAYYLARECSFTSVGRGDYYREVGNYPEAIMFYTRALDFVPLDVDALYNLGKTYALMGNREKAREYLEKAVKADSYQKDRAMKDEVLKELAGTI